MDYFRKDVNYEKLKKLTKDGFTKLYLRLVRKCPEYDWIWTREEEFSATVFARELAAGSFPSYAPGGVEDVGTPRKRTKTRSTRANSDSEKPIYVSTQSKSTRKGKSKKSRDKSGKLDDPGEFGTRTPVENEVQAEGPSTAELAAKLDDVASAVAGLVEMKKREEKRKKQADALSVLRGRIRENEESDSESSMSSSSGSEELEFTRFLKCKGRRGRKKSKEKDESGSSEIESDGEDCPPFRLTGLRLEVRRKERIATSLMRDWLSVHGSFTVAVQHFPNYGAN